jgi:hypothetical protein
MESRDYGIQQPTRHSRGFSREAESKEHHFTNGYKIGGEDRGMDCRIYGEICSDLIRVHPAYWRFVF